MELKTSIIGKKDNFFIKEPQQKGGADFNGQKFEKDEKKKKRRNNNKNNENIRLNDYDLNIMEEYAYKDLKDEVLKLECNITALENKLEKLNLEISSLEGLNQGVYLSDLKFKRDLIKTELANLQKKYENMSFSNGLSYRLSKFFSKLGKGNIFQIFSEFLIRYILPKCSKKFKYTVLIKDALNSLNTINSSVDELIKMQTPYGEENYRYEQLTAFLNKANYLHSQIIHKR